MIHNLDTRDYEVSGSTACCVENSAYIVGGHLRGHVGMETFLQVECMNLTTLAWKSQYHNTNGILNRSFHCSCLIDKEIFVFGGTSAESDALDQNIHEVVRISMTEYGLVSTTFCVDDESAVSLQGQSVCLMGKLKKYVLLYGGMSFVRDETHHTAVRAYRSNLSSFSAAHVEHPFGHVDVAFEDEVPPGRAFHTAVVCGDDNEFMIVCGGRNGESILNDIWLLDMSSVLLNQEIINGSSKDKKASESVKEVIPASAKRKGTQPIIPTARWSRIKFQDDSIFLPRQLHSSYFIPNKKSETATQCFGTFHVFGGVGKTGILSSKIEEFNFDFLERGAALSKKVKDHDNMEIAANVSISGYGSTTAAYYGPLDSRHNLPQALLIFGGSYSFNENRISSYCKAIIFDDENNILMQALKTKLVKSETVNSEPAIEEKNFTDLEENSSELKELNFTDIPFQNNGNRFWDKIVDGNGRLIYEGFLIGKEYDGEGTFYSENGDIHAGMFCKNEKHGDGVLTLSSGIAYKGNWNMGKLSEKCHVTSYPISKTVNSENTEFDFTILKIEKNKTSQGQSGLYTGYITNGLPSDMSGVCVYSDGGEYRGGWKSGRRNGQGTYKTSRGDTYKGKWVADVRSGRGTYLDAMGDSYEGLWDKDYPCGLGCRIYRLNKSSYRGNFSRGKRNGSGTMVFENGSELTGIWENDNLLDEIVEN